MGSSALSSGLEARFATIVHGTHNGLRFVAGTMEARTSAAASLAHKLNALGVNDVSSEGIAPFCGRIQIAPGARRGLCGVAAPATVVDYHAAPFNSFVSAARDLVTTSHPAIAITESFIVAAEFHFYGDLNIVVDRKRPSSRCSSTRRRSPQSRIFDSGSMARLRSEVPSVSRGVGRQESSRFGGDTASLALPALRFRTKAFANFRRG
jgi:hypothetical protein